MPVHNEDIAAMFEELADLLEIEAANPFRVRAYRNAARTVRGLGRDLAAMVDAGEDLRVLPGIGDTLAAKIREIGTTGSLQALERLHRRLPASLEDLLRLPGIGPKRARQLYGSGITSLPDLEKAARAGRLHGLNGFGKKIESKVLEAIGEQARSRRVPLFLAAEYGEALIGALKRLSGVDKAVIAGSYRRGQDTVGDLDIVATAKSSAGIMKTFTAYDEVKEVLSQGETRASVVLRSGLQVDLRVVKSEGFGAALQYFTGSKAHNIQLRRLARKRGLKINEYGVFKNGRRLGGDTENSVYAAVGLPLIEPELREGRGEIDAAREDRLPKLIAMADLKGDLHSHTDASDGRASLEAMARAARQRGLDYIAVTDHSKRLALAHGLDEARLRKQMAQIDRLNESLEGFRLLKGVEVDILEDGSLDLDDAVLRDLDVVVCSVHSHFNLSRKRQTGRVLRAMDNRHCTILGHPSGRLLGRREACDIDLEQIIRHAAQVGCFLELNSQPRRLDMADIYCRMARDEGVLVSIASDAHGESGLANLSLGVVQARRGWLEAPDALNTRSLRDLEPLLRARRG